MGKKIVYVTGLPRSGSTLLCQLLNEHPEIGSSGHSSPLAPTLEGIRKNLSGNDFFLSQLDVDFDNCYNQLGKGLKGFVDGWFADYEEDVVVDKNRGWLRMAELANFLNPDFTMLVCVRDLAQIFGSVEAQHQKTRLLEFPDNLDAYSPHARADRLFGKQGIVGGPLRHIENIQDLQDKEIQSKIFYVSFEQLVNNPRGSMDQIFKWIGVSEYNLDPDNLKVRPHESDSYYRFKYRHATHSAIRAPKPHVVQQRIARGLRERFKWYYNRFYSGPKQKAADVPDIPAAPNITKDS